MRRILPLALSTLLLAGSATAQQRASRSYDFVNSIGVNTHFTYIDTAYYQQPATLIKAIQYLHVRHVRDGLSYYWVAPNLYAIHAQLAQAGIFADLVTPNPEIRQARRDEAGRRIEGRRGSGRNMDGL